MSSPPAEGLPSQKGTVPYLSFFIFFFYKVDAQSAYSSRCTLMGKLLAPVD